MSIECGECGAPMVLRDSVWGKFYSCSTYPKCKGKHGAHQDSGKPLGIPANKETRQARIDVHDVFDVWWKDKGLSRSKAYKEFQRIMGMTRKEAHIGSLTKKQCNIFIEKLKGE